MTLSLVLAFSTLLYVVDIHTLKLLVFRQSATRVCKLSVHYSLMLALM